MSVVVPVRRAPDTIVSTMTELLERQGLEIIAVVSKDDPTSLLLRQLWAENPAFVLVEVNGDWSVPQLRARGVRQATGRLVAITEDHCSFSESWPAALAPPAGRPGDRGGGRSRRQREPQANPRLGCLLLALCELDAARCPGADAAPRGKQPLLSKRFAGCPCAVFSQRFLGTRVPRRIGAARAEAVVRAGRAGIAPEALPAGFLLFAALQSW